MTPRRNKNSSLASIPAGGNWTLFESVGAVAGVGYPVDSAWPSSRDRLTTNHAAVAPKRRCPGGSLPDTGDACPACSRFFCLYKYAKLNTELHKECPGSAIDQETPAFTQTNTRKKKHTTKCKRKTSHTWAPPGILSHCPHHRPSPYPIWHHRTETPSLTPRWAQSPC